MDSERGKKDGDPAESDLVCYVSLSNTSPVHQMPLSPNSPLGSNVVAI